MKIIIITDSFKGTMSSRESNQIIFDTIRKKHKDIILSSYLLADGGEGTIDAFNQNESGYHKEEITVTSPNRTRRIKSSYLLRNNECVIESAKSCGLILLKKGEADPFSTTSYGLGETIKDALNKGADKFIVGLGGSCVNDLGTGMLSGLGIRYLNAKGEAFLPSGGTLKDIVRIDESGIDSRVLSSRFTILTDVDNPLLGENGATYVYARQKGARLEDLPFFEENMRHLNALITAAKRRDYSKDKGMGAAGGLGEAFRAYFDSSIQKGADTILDKIDFNTLVKEADLVITGEGHIDKSTLFGKGVIAIAKYSKINKVAVLAIGGKIDFTQEETLKENGITYLLPLSNKSDDIENLKKHAKEDLRDTLMRFIDEHPDIFDKERK